jgi:hypothetical protein
MPEDDLVANLYIFQHLQVIAISVTEDHTHTNLAGR